MSQANLCSACGADLSSRASPEGYCPKCLLAFALNNGENGVSGPESNSRDAISATQIAQTPSSDCPNSIGPYRILQKLGEGGMGEVYLAEQTEPVRRRVALKLIKPGMDSKQVLARFESERQALALMDHPSIAKMFDGGTTEQGRPYFAMEYIEGEPITRYCDRHRLSTRERLGLFMRVCEGVQHAHQKGVIHRDIKPSNVLVTIRDQKPVPRIIDFGVAKATQHRLTERTVFTRLGVLIGTPEYMSPEQAEMTSLDVDTRTDVYSLGVLLYELLVGALPFDSEQLRQASFDELLRRIREDEPSKPSTRIRTLGGEASSAVARCRGVDAPTLRRALRGELDWITMRALEKDRTRRYQSPSELAADLARHIAHVPVLAGPPSTTYRARKFVRRHRIGVATTAAAIVVLLTFLATLAVQTGRIARERDRANAEASASERVSEFFTNMLGQLDQGKLGIALTLSLRSRLENALRDAGETEKTVASSLATLDGWLGQIHAADTMQELLDREILGPAAESIGEDLTGDPLIAGRLYHTLGATYRKIGLYEQGIAHVSSALEVRRDQLGNDAPETLESQWLLATLQRIMGRYDEARALYQDTIERQRRVLGADDPATLLSVCDFGWVLISEKRSKEAEPMIRDAVVRLRRVLGEDHVQTLRTLGTLGMIYLDQERYDEAADVNSHVVERWTRILGREHPRTLAAMTNLGETYTALGRFDEAVEILEEALERDLQVRGDDHPRTAFAKQELARAYSAQGRYADAVRTLRDAYEFRHSRLGPDESETLFSMRELANSYRGLGDHEKAAALAEECLELTRNRWGEFNFRTFMALDLFARIQAERGMDLESEKLHLAAIDGRREEIGDDHPETLAALRRLLEFYGKRGNLDRARPLAQELLEAERMLAESSDTSAQTKNLYARDLLTCELEDLRDSATALEFALEAAEMTEFDNPLVLDTLALAYYWNGDTAMAIKWEREALAIVPENQQPVRRVIETHLPGRAEMEARLAKYEAAAPKAAFESTPRPR